MDIKKLKWILVGTNIIFWLSGAVALGLGIWLAMYDDAYDILRITDPTGIDYTVWQITVYTMTAVGGMVFISGVIGTLGAYSESPALLITYCLLSCVALVGEVGCAVLAIIFSNDVNVQVAASMFNDIAHQYTTVDDSTNPYVTSWNTFQTMMKCCGSYNYTDWHKNENYDPAQYDTVPWTCCKMYEVHNPPLLSDVISEVSCYDEGQGTDPNSQPGFEFLNTKGCYAALITWYGRLTSLIYGTMLALACLQMIVLVVGCTIYCDVKNARVT